ncbi:dethiobiotin synthase [Alteromonas gracilis]|uniref:dethiobiotin synthase n=1 Tax=Alteromonas gracilis TaxID=1479524 RepID=UPI002FE2DD7B
MKQYFITGTDTEVGKTYVTCQLLNAAQRLSLRAIGYKPIAAGCELVNGEWVNEDALNIQKASAKIRVGEVIDDVDGLKADSENRKSGQTLPLHQINPIALKPAIAPHIAALEEGVALTFDEIAKGLDELHAYQPDLLFMEGAGGWRLPLTVGDEYTPTYCLSDVVKSLKMDVILVVGMRLGCLNHALLTAEAIRADGLTIKGWVANDVTGNMTRYQENLYSLKAMLPEPLLAEIPYQSEPNEEALFAAIEQIR